MSSRPDEGESASVKDEANGHARAYTMASPSHSSASLTHADAARTHAPPSNGNSQPPPPLLPPPPTPPLPTMLNRKCVWPFEQDQSCARRIRKSQRPAQASLRTRHFKGCSSIDQYVIGVKLGQGTFGEVKKATHFLTEAEVALKKVTIHEEKDGMPITAIREIKLLKRLYHPAIVPIIDMAYRAPTEPGKVGEVYMVEPYMDHDLNGMLENPSIQLNTSQIKLYVKQLFEGTLYLHQNKILHRDMKAANLLINNKGQLQIADFGLARPFHDPGRAWEADGWRGGVQSYTGMVVTRWYRPPELLAGERKYGPPIDMWGLGCIVAEMLVKHPVFKGSSEIDQMTLIAQLCGSPNELSYPGWGNLPGVKNADPNGRPDQEPDVLGQHDFGKYPRRVIEHFTGTRFMASSDLADLIDKLLVLDPRKRLTAKEALEHRWFWTAPFPADPKAMPTYQASKELDRQLRDQQRRQQQQQQQAQQQAQQQQAQLQHHQHQRPHQHPPPQHHHPHQQHQPRPHLHHSSGPPPRPMAAGGPGEAYGPPGGVGGYGGPHLRHQHHNLSRAPPPVPNGQYRSEPNGRHQPPPHYSSARPYNQYGNGGGGYGGGGPSARPPVHPYGPYGSGSSLPQRPGPPGSHRGGSHHASSAPREQR